ncbi:hypothetical protein J2Z40_002078 [Cytobacillus eiseniae]|uniref:Tissue inhibitor of metalloproteinase n=1 Tax=Cytobacillus eiseniae TaxID=762947 RepID=A0ABS4RGM7_9BACI|nr:hypothetical protein [Cytobacillus eiseniae]MBP2241515.1 hypothetical protein [Cytobacillus eiseniae]
MKRVVRYFLFIFIGMILISASPTYTSACSCAELPSVEEELERSKAVFSGKVVSVREKGYGKGHAPKSVLFEVSNTWKGVQQSQIIITTGLGGGDCGIDFKVGEEYLVYANESTMYGKSSLVSIICDRTNKISLLQEDLAILGDGQPPMEQVDLSREHSGSSFYSWILVIIAISAVGIFFIRRSKKNRK